MTGKVKPYTFILEIDAYLNLNCIINSESIYQEGICQDKEPLWIFATTFAMSL